MRDGADYGTDDWFTVANLKSKMPSEDLVCVVQMPGTDLERAASFSYRASRQDPPKQDSDSCNMLQRGPGSRGDPSLTLS